MNMFDHFPDVTSSEAINQMEKQPTPLKKKKWKKLHKQLKRQNKILEEIRNLLEAEKMVAETKPLPKAQKNTEDKKEKPFFKKLEDAVIKAVPAILTTTATAILGFFFKSNKGSNRLKGIFA